METFECVTTSDAHSLLITDVGFKPGSTIFATSSFDKTLKIWDATKVSCCLSLGSLRYFSYTHTHTVYVPNSLEYRYFFIWTPFFSCFLLTYLFFSIFVSSAFELLNAFHWRLYPHYKSYSYYVLYSVLAYYFSWFGFEKQLPMLIFNCSIHVIRCSNILFYNFQCLFRISWY